VDCFLGATPGAKVSISVAREGVTFLNPRIYEPYNEGKNPKAQAIAYRRHHGHYPEVICTDQIYRTRSKRVFCHCHEIRLSDKRFG
jgi:IS5 family transposase